MEQSILTSTKKVLGLGEEYTPFDLDVITHINSAFSIVTQLGIGPTVGFMIEDNTAVWADFEIPEVQLNLLKSYIYLKTRILFDPPGTSFLLSSLEDLSKEYEWRLNNMREVALAVNLPPAIVPTFEGQADPEPDPDPDPQLTSPVIVLEAQPNAILVQWETVPNAENYIVYHRVVGDGSWIVDTATDTNSFIFSSEVGVEYEIFVKAIAAAYTSADSDLLIITGIIDTPSLDDPQNLIVQGNADGTIHLIWEPVNNVELYTVWWKVFPDGEWNSDTQASTGDEYQLASFPSSEGVQYLVYIQATAEGYNAGTSDQQLVTGIEEGDPPLEQLGLITDVVVTAFSGYVQVTWVAPEHAEYIRIDYQSEEHGSFDPITFDAADSVGTFETEPGIEYELRLVASGTGYSVRVTSWMDVTGLDLPDLDPPVNGLVTPISDHMQITWEATPNVEFVLIWFRVVGDEDWDVNGWGIDQLSVLQNSEVGVEYEYYLQATADGYDPAESEHFFVTGI